MDNVRIIFFDIDGTLIDMERKVISENTLNALSALKKKGIKICIATGRSPMQVPVFPGGDLLSTLPHIAVSLRAELLLTQDT